MVMKKRSASPTDFSEATLLAIVGAEGYSSIAYHDSKGIPTIGYGFTL